MMDEKLIVRLIQRPATAFHEAGHAVVALAMGVKVTRVWIDEEARGCTEMDGAARFDPSRAWEYARGRRQLFATLRQGLVIHVAGHVASCLHDQWAAFGEWLPANRLREEKREWGEDWDFASASLISNRFKAGEAYDLVGDDSDYGRAMRACFAIWASKWQQQNRTLFAMASGEVVPFTIPPEKMLGEIRRAERRAEKLRKEHWAAVEEIVDGLLKSKSGRLGQRRLKKVVVSHFESCKVAVA